MRIPLTVRRQSWCVAACGLALLFAACSSKGGVGPSLAPDVLQLTAAQVESLQTRAQQIAHANQGDPDLTSLVDSTLMVLMAGVQAKRVAIETNLTTAPLYLVGIHRAVTHTQGAFSTWTLVAFDDPSQLSYLIVVSGFARGTQSTPPPGVTGTIGDGSGAANAMFLQVGAGGAVTKWHAVSGTSSFTSDLAKAACPGFVATPVVSCALDTMHVRFTASALSGSGGAGARQATLSSDADVPAIRLTYTP